jgi:hypothetical protein
LAWDKRLCDFKKFTSKNIYPEQFYK